MTSTRRLLYISSVVPPLLAVAYYYHMSSNASMKPTLTLAAMRAAHASLNNNVGKRALVVGGTSGIGEGIAIRLAEANFAVTIVGRDEKRGAAIVEQLASKSNAGVKHDFMACDASLLGNVVGCAARYSVQHDSLDVLVLTQGIATMQGRTPTTEGIDVKMALHYYGRMAFVDALLPLLRNTPTPKVLSVLSAGVHAPYKNWSDDPELKTHYSLKNAADAAGFYNDLALDALSRDSANAKVCKQRWLVVCIIIVVVVVCFPLRGMCARARISMGATRARRTRRSNHEFRVPGFLCGTSCSSHNTS